MPLTNNQRDSLLNSIAAKLADGGVFWTRITNLQGTYFAANGKYFQGLLTHSALPVEGATVVPDRLSGKPSDQTQSWVSVGWPNTAVEVSAKIDVYQSVAGWGYVVEVSLRINNLTYRMARAFGPEATRRSFAWRTT